MPSFQGKLLSTTFIPALMGVGGLIAVATVAVPVSLMTVKPAAAACNPCAAKKPANACNPCAAKKPCGACNPCAAKKACNPCAAKNPCAANACNPCAAKSSANCVVPSVQKAAACNPCAAKKPSACGACNPCAAKKACNPCNPCAAKNPCAASNPCNPCGPCGASAMADVELEPAEANATYDCLKADMKNSYAKSGLDHATYYTDWKVFSTAPYASGTHGGRHVSNYANAVAEEAYLKYEENGRMPVGSVLAKDSFAVQTDGRAVVGPLFVMEKMAAGFSKASGDWKYTLILPNGQTVGTTNSTGTEAVTFCYECHMAAEDTDSLFFLPEEYRVN
ncbi:MAG: hypothetical protein COB93_06240 [Sneathiella sp.]|nr:MAG: hypothetical protein COB93_06240 [Sneathiella sp.]